MRRFHDSLVRGFGGVIGLDGFGADAFFGHQLHRGAEEVVEEPPFVLIEGIE